MADIWNEIGIVEDLEYNTGVLVLLGHTEVEIANYILCEKALVIVQLLEWKVEPTDFVPIVPRKELDKNLAQRKSKNRSAGNLRIAK